MGGLGNQMFQYAAGHALSLKLNTEFKLDHSFLEADSKGTYTQRHYELNVFNGLQRRAENEELLNIAKARKKNILSAIFKKSNFTIYNEQGFPYNKEIENLSGDIYLNGFWQCEKYFAGMRQTILDDFSLKTPLSKEAVAIKEEINAKPASVSIHFRRGDYVKLESASVFHGTAELDYYRQAIEIIQSKINSPIYYIFSDEIDWVKQNFKIENATYVNGLKSHEDLELMKNCKHNITANSSFSWWGAWLNTNSEKTVIAPQQWFKDISVNTIDLIPSSWHKI